MRQPLLLRIGVLLVVAGCDEGPLPSGRYVAAGTVASSGGDVGVCAVLLVEGDEVLLVTERAPYSDGPVVAEYRGTVSDEGGCTMTLTCDRVKSINGEDEPCIELAGPIACSLGADGSVTLDYSLFATVPFTEDGVCADAFRLDEAY